MLQLLGRGKYNHFFLGLKLNYKKKKKNQKSRFNISEAAILFALDIILNMILIPALNYFIFVTSIYILIIEIIIQSFIMYV